MKFPTRLEKKDPNFMAVFEEEKQRNRSPKQAYKETKKRLGLTGKTR